MYKLIGIQRCDLRVVASWPRDAVLQGIVTARTADGCFVKFGNGRLVCSKDGVLRGADATLEKDSPLTVRVRSLDVARNRCTLELATAAAVPASIAGCFRCGVAGHRARECPERPAPIASRRAREVSAASTASVATDDVESVADSLASARSRSSRGGGRRRRSVAAVNAAEPANDETTAAPAVEAPAEAGNAKERRRQRRAADQAHAEQTGRQLCEMLKCALARKGVHFEPADSEEVLRARLVEANAKPKFFDATTAEEVPPPVVKFGSFGTSDSLITASMVDKIASCPEAPAALFRRLSSAGAA